MFPTESADGRMGPNKRERAGTAGYNEAGKKYYDLNQCRCH